MKPYAVSLATLVVALMGLGSEIGKSTGKRNLIDN